MQSVEDKTTQELDCFPLVSAEPVTNDGEDPTSDPLAEDPAPALTYRDVQNINTHGAFNDVNQDPGEMTRCSTKPSAMKRPRMMVGGQSGSSTRPRMPPGPRMWKSPAQSPLLTDRPLCRVVSQPYQMQAAELEIIDVEEEEQNNMMVVLPNLPSTVTLIRTNEVSLEREARKIAEVMTGVANKLAGVGRTRTVDRDILEAKKMLNRMANRLEL